MPTFLHFCMPGNTAPFSLLYRVLHNMPTLLYHARLHQ